MNSPVPADLLFLGIPVYGSEASGNADAVAVVAGEIAAVGTRREVEHRFKGPETTVIDRGGSLIPGLVDAHAHMDREGLKAVLPTLDGATTTADVLDRIATLASEAAPGEWITCMPLGGAPRYEDTDSFESTGYPNRHDLDAAAPNNPVYIKPVWGYWRPGRPLVSIANSLALEAAGIDVLPPDPIHGVEVLTDVSGRPTGVFVEHTTMPIVELTIMAAAPGFTTAQRTAALAASQHHYNRNGTTGVVEAHGASEGTIDLYRTADTGGVLSVRSHLFHSPSWSTIVDRSSVLRTMRREQVSPLLSMGGIYVEIDQDRRNWVRVAAAPQTGWAGFNYDAGLPLGDVLDLLVEAARQGVQVACIDPAIVEMFDAVHAEVPIDDLRWSWHHISTMTAADIDRAARLGLVVVAHTHRHIAEIGTHHMQRLGETRQNEILPLRSLVDAGVPVAFETDNFPPTMLPTIAHAVTRIDDTTGEDVAPGQALGREEALRCATAGGSFLAGNDAIAGTIDVGKRGDVVVLDRDLGTIADDQLSKIGVNLTVVDGRIVYEAQTTGPF